MRYSESILGVSAAADWLNVHPKTVLRYIRDGRLPAVRIGKTYRIAVEALEALVGSASSKVGAAPRNDSGTGSDQTAPEAPARATCIVAVREVSAASAGATVAFLHAALQAAHQVKSDTSAGVRAARLAQVRLQLETAFDADAGQLRVVLIGPLEDVSRMLELLAVQRRSSR